jgi:hypothetical protein
MGGEYFPIIIIGDVKNIKKKDEIREGTIDNPGKGI